MRSQRIISADDLKTLGTILFVGAHPDDETFTAGGLLAAAVANGQRVAIVMATRGEVSTQGGTVMQADRLLEVRTREHEEAMRILGVRDHVWLDYEDGRCADVPDEGAVARLAEVMQRVQPDTILTFGPEGMTGHEDHKAVSRWSAAATLITEKPIRILHVVHTMEQYEQYLLPYEGQLDIFFNIDRPRTVAPDECAVYFELPERELDQKYRALAAMPSQYTKILEVLAPDGVLGGGLSVECFVEA